MILNNFLPFALPLIGDDEISEVVDTLKSGWLTTGKKTAAFENQFQEFVEAGFSNRHVLDIVLAISHKVISNYTNHLVETPLDDRFSANRWSPPE